MPFSAQHIKAARLHLMQSDPAMKRLIKRVGPFTARMIPDENSAAFESLDDSQVIEKLLADGLSRQRANEYLMFSLGRLDVLPLSDVRLQTAVADVFELTDVSEQKLAEVAAKWRPYATIAAWYLIQDQSLQNGKTNK